MEHKHKHPEHIFIEDIIYCPSQIYYYFSDNDGTEWVAYIRQRRGPLTFELMEIDKESGDWKWDWKGGTNKVILSRAYDINNQPTQEAEDKEIEAVEEEVLWYLRQQFPEIKFPDHPVRL